MKVTLIRIDRKSIKVNKNAGSRMSHVAGPREVTFDCEGELPKELVDGKNCHIVSWQDRNGKRFWTHGYIIDAETEKLLWDKIAEKKLTGFNLKMERNLQAIYHPPISKYSFKYKDKKLICGECKGKITYSTLQSDSRGFGDYSDTICPICGAWDCVQLEFENINTIYK